jgi:hypothetical protein
MSVLIDAKIIGWSLAPRCRISPDDSSRYVSAPNPKDQWCKHLTETLLFVLLRSLSPLYLTHPFSSPGIPAIDLQLSYPVYG